MCFGYFTPNYYTSSAYLLLQDTSITQLEGRIKTPAILRPVIEKFGDPASSNRTMESRERDLAKHIYFYPQPGETRKTATIVRLEVVQKDAHAAQAICNGLIDAWLESTKPAPQAKTVLLERISRTEISLKDIAELITLMLNEISKSGTAIDPQGGNKFLAITSLIARQDERRELLASLKNDLSGTPRDVIFSSATLADRPNSKHLWIFGVLGGLAGLVLSAAAFVLLGRVREVRDRVRSV